MDRPVTMSVKEFLVRKLSTELLIDERIIMVIIAHQFDTAMDALKHNRSVELPGFGKFLFKDGVAQRASRKKYTKKKYLEKILENSTSERANWKLRKQIEEIDDFIKYVEEKRQQQENEKVDATNCRGMAKPSVPEE